MEKKRTITIYRDMNEPDLETLREDAKKTPEELWKSYIKLRRLYVDLTGKSTIPAKHITISRPLWM